MTTSQDDCPCGCGGEFDKHDDRSYGFWECPRCGKDSDRDLGKPCFECENHIDLRLTRSRDPLGGSGLHIPTLRIRIVTDEYIYEEWDEA